ncbi:MAG: hypothetical protein K2I72_00935, partial [Bacilli bacterium]|nr:hypothetical protein [Bacilli bacterium]
FCLSCGYSHKKVYCEIKLHEFCKHDTLEQLINRVITNNLNKSKIPSSWVYEAYGSLIESILLALGLDASCVLMNMSNCIISLEEAICCNTFECTCKNEEFDYLVDIWLKVIKTMDFKQSEQKQTAFFARKLSSLSAKNNLIEAEKEILKKSFARYQNIMREYYIMDVGLETDENRKLEKIKQYDLSEEDIEESYFVPFRFESGKLLGRKSELYQRRSLLRQYIIDWDYYTKKEKRQVGLENHFTDEELIMIQNMRMEINSTLGKVKIRN